MLLISGLGSVSAWGNRVVTDTFPAGATIYISLADLPALLSGNIVGITLDQMDTLSVDMINLDAARDSIKVCDAELDTALIEVHRRDMIIIDHMEKDELQENQLKANTEWIATLNDRNGYLERENKKQRRKTGLAWFFAGLGTAGGFAAGILLAN